MMRVNADLTNANFGRMKVLSQEIGISEVTVINRALQVYYRLWTLQNTGHQIQTKYGNEITGFVITSKDNTKRGVEK